MKDLTHYFADTTKSCESSPSELKDNLHGKDQQEYRGSSPRKRKRVKIKISRTNSRTRVCDIVESKSDLIDKTPSPFARTNGGQKVRQALFEETPKKTSSHLPLVASDLAEMGKEKRNGRSQVLKDDKAARVLKERNSKYGRKKFYRGKKNILKESADNECVYVAAGKNVSPHDQNDVEEIDLSEREESNAFQVLMNSSKPVQNTQLQNVSQEKITNRSEEDKDKLKKNKEKLLTLADKKGYTKRKLAEIEEDERIEKKIENRMKLFKVDTKTDEDPDTSGGSQKQLSGNLLNYFSKTTLDTTQKDVTTVSTIVVKADVHLPDDAVKNCFYKGTPQLNQTDSKKGSKDSSVAVPENTTTEDVDEKQGTTKTPKPKWSMRIKLQSNKDETNSGANNDEEFFSPRSQAKFKDDTSCNSNKNNNDVLIIEAESQPKKSKVKERRDKSTSRKNSKRKSSAENSICNRLSDKITADLTDPVNSDIEEVKQINQCNSITSAAQALLAHDKRTSELIDIDSDGTIVLSDGSDHIESNVTSKKKGSEKLAPLFTKKPKPDQAVIAARRLFLQSDSTEENSKKADKKDKSTGPYFLPFPLISHVNQHTDNSHYEPNIIKLSMKAQTKYTPTVSVHSFKQILDLQYSPTASTKTVKKPARANIEDALSDIETRCADARKIWARVSSVAKSTNSSKGKSSPEGKGKSRRTTSKKETTPDSKKKENDVSETWTFKYKPLSTQDVAGNEEAAAKLKLWLDGWRSTLTEDNDSENEFYSSDCSYSSNNENNQVAVLIGPHGVGKSASVYAVADELGYSVLEVNASSKRPGKKVLKELEEATKSHRIKKDEIRATFFSKNKPKAENKIPQKTLILLEDIDLIFDEDEGFVNATYQLASNTKRPIAMTCRDVCPHLNKMAPQQNKIYFQGVENDRMWTHLELISLAETGYRIPCSYLADLLQTGDLRKALLQLQFLLLSGPQTIPEQHVNFSKNLWQDLRHYVYKPTIKVTKKQVTKKNQRKIKMRDKSEDALYDLAHKLDVISVLTSLVDVNDPALDISNIRERPSLSLVEDKSPYCVTKSISFDIGHWLRDKVICNEALKDDRKPEQNNILLRKQLNTGVDFALSSVTPSVLDRRAISVDYLPSMRTICRSEEVRHAMNSKRGNRFFHYLHGLKLPATSTKPNILSAACKMMQERVKTETSTTVSIE